MVVTDLGILADDPEKLSAALREAATGHDLIVTSGGVSTGEADYVRNAVERIGSLVFWRVAIKPGRPVALWRDPRRRSRATARLSSACQAIPVAVFVTFVRVVKPLLRRLSGARPDKTDAACRCAPHSRTGKRKIAVNMCAWRSGVARTARSRRSNTRRMARAFSRR